MVQHNMKIKYHGDSMWSINTYGEMPNLYYQIIYRPNRSYRKSI